MKNYQKSRNGLTIIKRKRIKNLRELGGMRVFCPTVLYIEFTDGLYMKKK